MALRHPQRELCMAWPRRLAGALQRACAAVGRRPPPPPLPAWQAPPPCTLAWMIASTYLPTLSNPSPPTDLTAHPGPPLRLLAHPFCPSSTVFSSACPACRRNAAHPSAARRPPTGLVYPPPPSHASGPRPRQRRPTALRARGPLHAPALPVPSPPTHRTDPCHVRQPVRSALTSKLRRRPPRAAALAVRLVSLCLQLPSVLFFTPASQLPPHPRRPGLISWRAYRMAAPLSYLFPVVQQQCYSREVGHGMATLGTLGTTDTLGTHKARITCSGAR